MFNNFHHKKTGTKTHMLTFENSSSDINIALMIVLLSISFYANYANLPYLYITLPVLFITSLLLDLLHQCQV